MLTPPGQPRRRTFGAPASIVVALIGPLGLGWRFTLKHAADYVLAVLALMLLAPLLLVIALGVRLSSTGPVILRQRRVGRGGESFDLLKFRTMVGDDSGDPGFMPAPGVAPGGIEGADRRTMVGRWLRAVSLDELPQLLNVLRGEMSLVGPRPERPEFVERFVNEVPGYTGRHRVKSGITGWAQANGLRGQTSIYERVAFDNYYIENWSFALDLRILALTVVEVLRFRDGRKARPAGSSGSAPRVQRPAPQGGVAARVASSLSVSGSDQTDVGRPYHQRPFEPRGYSRAHPMRLRRASKRNAYPHTSSDHRGPRQPARNHPHGDDAGSACRLRSPSFSWRSSPRRGSSS